MVKYRWPLLKNSFVALWTTGESELSRRTYAACAQAMVGAIREVELA